MGHYRCLGTEERWEPVVLCGLAQDKCLRSSVCLPIAQSEESLMALGQATFFSLLDLASGYWPVREQDWEKLPSSGP